MPASRPLLLRVALLSENLVLARTVAASVCAQLDFPIDQLDDVRLAVDEACSLLLSETDGSDLDVEFLPGDGELTVTVSGGTNAATLDPATHRSPGWSSASCATAQPPSCQRAD